MSIPQIYIYVQGGIADYEVTRGEVEIVFVDWDNIDDKYAEPGMFDLEDARDRLRKIANPAWRKDALDRVNNAISDLQYQEEMELEREKAAEKKQIEDARKVLREAGELS